MIKKALSVVFPKCSRIEAEVIGYGLACMTMGYWLSLAVTRK